MPRAQLTRREWVALAGLSAGGALLGSVWSCGSSTPTEHTTDPVGTIEGEIFDVFGARQPSLGRIYLMYSSGEQTGRYVDVDANGRFLLSDVQPGDWQLRFHAPGVAYVPEEYQHPVRVTVHANETTDVRIIVEHGWEDGVPMLEIYIGDYFFQEQPSGKENGVAVVKLGVPVCWYNVGLMQHRIVGPFWDSGVLERAGSYIWIPDRVGDFPYYCAFHRTSMIATLSVVA